jgi:pimeloyl-ACP methyl ester carboxylesterase
VLHREIEISGNDYQIKASLIIPDNKDSKIGVVLAHGGIVNRKSLLRAKYCFGEYLCKELGAYIIAPDFLEITLHKKTSNFSDNSEILNISTDYLTEKYGVDKLMGFAHSMGCYSLVQSLQSNDRIKSIVNFGGPIKEVEKISKIIFIKSLIKYVSYIKPSVNVKRFTSYIFDEETCDYLINVMLMDKNYGYQHYNFDGDLKMCRDILIFIDEYINLIKKWGKPALLLFGTHDTLVDNTRSYYYDGYVDNNVTVKHIPDCSHVTPCMESVHQLSKLNSVIKFYKMHACL